MMMFFASGVTSTNFYENAGAVADALKKNLTGVRDVIEEIDKEFSKVANNIGAGREQAFLLKQTLTEGLTEITRLGGSVSDITKQVEGLQKTFGTQIILNKNVTDELFATTKATGIEADVLFESYTNVGKSIYDVNSEMAQIMENSNLIGVNAKSVTAAVNANMSALSKFNFKDGVMGLADMAAKSAVLRVGMEKAVASAEELYKPEKAQSFVNTLSRLGATGSSELMNVERVRFLARNEPAKLQEEIAKMSSKFVDETGKMSAIGMDFLKEIATESGYSADELSKMGIAMSQLQDKQNLINTAGLSLAPDSKEMEKLTNLLTKGKDGKFEVTYEQDGQQVTKALQDMNAYEKTKLQDFLTTQNKQIKETFESKPGEDKNLVKLVEQQMDITSKFANAVKAIETVASSQIAGSKQGEKFVKEISENIDKITTTSFQKLDTITDEIGKVVDIQITEVGKAATQIITNVGDSINKLNNNSTVAAATTSLSTAFGTLSGAFGNFTDWLRTSFKLDDFISLPGNDRLIMGPEGSIGRINDKDTIISTTDGPKTEDEVKMMMDLIKNPQGSVTPTTIETKPILTSETMGTISATDSMREKELSKIMMENSKVSGETTKEIKSTNDINHKLDMTIDLKNVPTNMNQNELKSVLETMILKPEFLDKVRAATKSIEGTSFY
jgi:hypothetical protein